MSAVVKEVFSTAQGGLDRRGASEGTDCPPARRRARLVQTARARPQCPCAWARSGEGAGSGARMPELCAPEQAVSTIPPLKNREIGPNQSFLWAYNEM